jgi:hypothetical protein
MSNNNGRNIQSGHTGIQGKKICREDKTKGKARDRKVPRGGEISSLSHESIKLFQD